MKKFKSIAIVLALLLLVTLVAGCQPKAAPAAPAEEKPAASDSGSTASEAPAADAGSWTFGNLTYSRKDVWNNASAVAFEWLANKVGVTPLIMECDGDMEKQMDAMQTLINQKVDGISIYTITPELDLELSKMADAAGIPVAIENSLPAEGTIHISVACYDYFETGVQVGEMISDMWAGKKVLMVHGAPGMNIVEPIEEGFWKAKADKGDTFEVVDVLYTDWGTETAMNQVQDFLQTGKAFDAMYIHNGQMFAGGMVALKDAGLEGKIPCMTMGGSASEIDWIKSGELYASLGLLPNAQGMAVFKSLYMYLNGETPPASWDLPMVRITQENVATAPNWDDNEGALKLLGGI